MGAVLPARPVVVAALGGVLAAVEAGQVTRNPVGDLVEVVPALLAAALAGAGAAVLAVVRALSLRRRAVRDGEAAGVPVVPPFAQAATSLGYASH
jgi:exosome complex RNA-binding protein Csl4